MSRRLVATALLLALAGCHHPVYYHGPKSDHFDGRRFFNPDGEQGSGGAQRTTLMRYIDNALFHQRHKWPKSVPVTPTVPPRRVEGLAMRATWIGHSTVLVQTDGLNILTDPVWAERASPVQWAGPRRVRQPGVRLADLPRINLVLLSHDHYDHMDLATLGTLWRRDRPLIVTGLGNDERLRENGIRAVGLDWNAKVALRPGVKIWADRAHHWSARTKRDHDRTLWEGFTVTLPGGDLYYAGDTGPGDMRWPIEALRGHPVRLALLPIGATHIRGDVTGNHIGPADAVAAFVAMRASSALGVHWGTFELTDEPIDLPRERLAAALAADRLSAARFRTLEAGQAWEVPPIAPQSAATLRPR